MPPIADERLQRASSQICCGISTALRTQRVHPCYIPIDLDIWRYVTNGQGQPSEHSGHVLLQQNELSRFKHLPQDWWYHLNSDGDGVAIDFPFKAKPILSWSAKKLIKDGSGNLVEAKRHPIEKVCLTIIRKPFNADFV